MFRRILIILGLSAISTFAQVIPTNQIISWIPGVTVGLRSPVPTRTSIIDVTQSPYNADNTGTHDASTAINSAITAAIANQVIYFPDGNYLLSNSIYFTKNYITLRGNTNTTLIALGSAEYILKCGKDNQVGYGNGTYTVTSGGGSGSTNIVLGSAPGPNMQTGDQFYMTENTTLLGSATWPVIDAHQYDNTIGQQCVIYAVHGSNITLAAPLAFNFTNNPIAIDQGIHSTIGVGIENLTITDTNTATGGQGNYSFMLYLSMCHDCWITNVSLQYPQGYCCLMSYCAHMWLAQDAMQKALSSGPDHSGLAADHVGESLIENNMFTDGLQPAIEFNSGFSANAIFANYMTNNVIDVDCHNTHPVMNLWEANICSGYYELDGYYGSASHQTLFRNAIQSGYIPLLVKRWNSYINIVGNVLGSAGGNYGWFAGTNWAPSQGMIIQFGYPNIGNNSYDPDYTAPPAAWNYPGTNYIDIDGANQANGIFTLTNTAIGTTNLLGLFTNIPAPSSGAYSLVFQDPVNTNLYYPTNGTPVTAYSAGTYTNLYLSAPIDVVSGWKVFMSGQNAYQQLQLTNATTALLTGNYDYFNNATTWGSNGVQTMPNSYLYASAPVYWGGDRWPAIDPMAVTLITPIPAEQRYYMTNPPPLPPPPVIYFHSIGPAK